MIGLTHQMQNLLDYITTSTAENRGVAPSFVEMMSACNIKSRSNVFRLLNCLEERGHIKRLPNRARAIEVCGLAAAD